MTERPLPVLYGLVHCDTVKKARAWLDGQGMAYRFHDFRKAGVPEDALRRWLTQPGWQTLLNRQGTTWRKLDEAQRETAVDAEGTARLLREQPSLIKRPVVDWPDGRSTVGFSRALFEQRRAGG